MKFLGIDIGTGGTRAVLIDGEGRVIAAVSAEHANFTSPQLGWAEQDPDDWWHAATRAIPQCLAQAKTDASELNAIGLTGQMHGLVALDPENRVLRPAIIWCDQRTEAECREIADQVGAKRLIELTANPALTVFTLPKIRWMQKHEPQLWSRVRTILLPKDYVRFRLTGARATDVADASGTLLFDVANRQWSAPMLDVAKLQRELLPQVFEGPQITGEVSEEGSRATGLRVGTPVAAGAGDQAAGAVGMGIVEPGAVSSTIGTSGVVFAATAAPVGDPQGRIHTFCHAFPNHWHVMGVTQAAGLSLKWFREQFTANGNATGISYAHLTEEAAKIPAGAEGLLWAPYLMGERTPHLNPNARAALVGLTASHTRAHIVRAILEGVAFSLRDCLTVFSELEIPVTSIRLGGGGARSPLWCQIQGDIFGREVSVLQAEEGPAFGAALLAGVGVGAWPSVPHACEASVHVARRFAPDADRTAAMNRQYAKYTKLYPLLQGIAP
jgi:xylulokinase